MILFNLPRFNSFSKYSHLGILISSALCLLFLFTLGLGNAYLFDVDEGAFAEATREMLESKDWLHTTLNGADRFDKPIGIYWLQALSVGLLGETEFAFRLPSALAGCFASLTMARFAYRQWGSQAAWIAGVISATSLGPWAISRTASADALLGLFFVLIFFNLWRALESGERKHGRFVALWIGLGLLVKGPIAIIVPVGTLLVSAAINSNFLVRVRSLIADPIAWVIIICTAMPWYVYAYLRHGQLFIDGFLLKHNIERFTNSLEGHSGNWTYFFLALPVLWFPWSTLWVSALFDLRRREKNPLLQFAWIWFAFVFLFFTLSNTKLPHYLLYASPAMCLLLVDASLSANRNTWKLTWLFGMLGLAAILCLPSVIQMHPDWIKDPFYQSLVLSSSTTDMRAWIFVFPIFFITFSGLQFILEKLCFTAKIQNPCIGYSFFAIFQTTILSLFVLPWWSETLQSPVNTLAIHFKSEPANVVQWGVHLPSFSAYRQQISPNRKPEPGELALVKNMEIFWPSNWLILESKGPLSIIKRPIETDVHP